MQISFKIKDAEFQKFLADTEKRLADSTPAFRAIGEYVRGSVVRTFEAEGRPAPWQSLAESTLYGRVRGKRRGKGGFFTGRAAGKILYSKILQRTGRLKKSIGFKAGRERVAIGTNLIYGAIQHFGGMAGPGRKVRIPARPYIVLQPEDQPAVEKIMGDWCFLGATAEAYRSWWME